MEDIEKTQTLSGKFVKIQAYIDFLNEEKSKIKDLDLHICKQFLNHAITALDVEHDIPPTKPYPTGSGSSHSVLKQSTPEIPSAVNSEIQTKQADLGLSSASSGPTSPSEPSMPASVTIAASTPKLTETLTSATVASALQASVPEQTVDPSTSTQLGLIEKVQPTTATLDGPSGKSLPATSSSADLDPATPAITPHLAAPIDSPQDAVVENPSLSITENRLPASQTIKEGQPQLKLTFAEISASPARKSDLNSQISLPIRLPMPIISTYTAVTDTPSSLTVAFDYDVSKGGLIVDLSPHFIPSSAAPSEDESFSSQQGFSTPESLSEEDDNPDDENDHHPEFAEVLHQCWNSLPFSGSKMFLRVAESFSKLQSFQHALLASPSPSLAALERTAHRKWIMLAKAEESFLRQRAHIQWLAEGDCNSAFFYHAIISHSAQNFIHMLLDSSDRVIDDLQGIKDHILGFYQNLLRGEIQPTSSSPDLIGDLSNHPSHSTTLRRIAAQATIYILWYERNNRLHNSISSSPATLFKLLDRLIKDTIFARRNMKSFNGLLRHWLAFS
ncbi:hypothetical protein HID58_054037 [Brassica napus]|uniref:Gamma-tubulin complex component n=1 Tax=Brassica napus TaxID=3708 RepID=A0ABQ8AHC5_BRANA|nr:hypothetical protein HID58_054037 [Brassica napus]